MGQLVPTTSGNYRCNGKYCGYPLRWFACEPGDGAEGVWTCLDCNASVYAAKPSQAPATEPVEAPKAPIVSEAHNSRGYDDISTVYAYYTPEQKAEHGKHCEHWTEFGHKPETAPYRTGQERAFVEKIEAENPGKFASYLISWSGCE